MDFFKNPGPGKITSLISLAMVVVFLGLGFLLIFTNELIDKLPRPNRTWIGLLLIAWAVFRGLSVWTKLRRTNDDEDENTY